MTDERTDQVSTPHTHAGARTHTHTHTHTHSLLNTHAYILTHTNTHAPQESVELDSDVDDMLASDPTSEAIPMMQAKLPKYVVNGFLAAGYDTLEVIADLDEDSLQEIEQFISENYPHDPKYLPNATSSCLTGLRFPPGHRKRILMFVEQTKKSIVRGRKRQNRPSTQRPRVKKSVIDGESSSSESTCNQADVTSKIRRLIAKWQRTQKDVKLRELKEHEHFVVRVKVDLSSSILCKMCGRCSVLGRKSGSVMLSNWTRHVTNCVQKQPTATKQRQLTLPLSPSLSSTGSLSSPEFSSPSPTFPTPTPPNKTSDSSSKQTTEEECGSLLTTARESDSSSKQTTQEECGSLLGEPRSPASHDSSSPPSLSPSPQKRQDEKTGSLFRLAPPVEKQEGLQNHTLTSLEQHGSHSLFNSVDQTLIR